MEQSNDQIASFQTELKSLKEEKQPDYRAAVGHVAPGRIVIPPPKHQSMLGIRAGDIPESHASTADERMLDDIAAIGKLLKFMDIEDRKLTKVVRIGEYDQKRDPANTAFPY